MQLFKWNTVFFRVLPFLCDLRVSRLDCHNLLNGLYIFVFRSTSGNIRRGDVHGMSKYDKLWEFIRRSGKDSFEMTFDEIHAAAGIPIDHSFLRYKKELTAYGYEVGKISLKQKTAAFNRKK